MLSEPTARVLVMTPDSDAPIGGVKMHYQVVDALNRNGVAAMVIHRRSGFRCTWFDNTTAVGYSRDTPVNRHDVLVVPEEWIAAIPELPSGIPKVVFNQNAYSTFSWGADAAVIGSVLSRSDVTHVVAVSDDNVRYLRYAFPTLDIRRIRYTIDQSLFHSSPGPKRRQIAYMPRRRAQEALDVLSLLASRGALADWQVVALDQMKESQVAARLRESAIFLSFSHREGLGLPPAEAMASGCIVIGFHGLGGRDFGDHALWVPEGDVVEFAQTVESVLTSWEEDTTRFRVLAERAATHIRDTYCTQNTERDVVAAFRRSTAGVEAGPTLALSGSTWESRSLMRRIVGRATRAGTVLLRG